MTHPTATLPDGRTVFCVNDYEVAFSALEIFSEDLARHGLDLPAEGTYLDVGANIGLFSLYLRDHCPGARIYAYEPMPRVFGALEGNMAAMRPPGRAVQLALGAASGSVEFDYFPGISALSTGNSAVGQRMSQGLEQLLLGAGKSDEVRDLVASTGAQERVESSGFVENLFRTERVTVEMDTLSNQMADLGIDRIDLLKVDTEGSEKEVLAGIAESDWPKIRQLLVEVHLGKEETEALEQELRQRGFRTSLGSHPLSQGGAAVYHVYATRGPAELRG